MLLSGFACYSWPLQHGAPQKQMLPLIALLLVLLLPPPLWSERLLLLLEFRRLALERRGRIGVRWWKTRKMVTAALLGRWARWPYIEQRIDVISYRNILRYWPQRPL